MHDDPWAPEPVLFEDRRDAGQQIAQRLGTYAGAETLVLGIPRGGLVVANAVAEVLSARLDVIVARKLGAPANPELAIGAVTAGGAYALNHKLIASLGVSPRYVDEVIARERAEAQRRDRLLRDARPAPHIAGRIVIVVDDGLATGATMQAALGVVRTQMPALLIAAVPVCSLEAGALVRGLVDHFIALAEPYAFQSVGSYFGSFDQVADDEVIRLLAEARSRGQAKGW